MAIEEVKELGGHGQGGSSRRTWESEDGGRAWSGKDMEARCQVTAMGITVTRKYTGGVEAGIAIRLKGKRSKNFYKRVRSKAWVGERGGHRSLTSSR